MPRLYFWRYGITFGRWGHWGVYLGIPFVASAREPVGGSCRGLRWVGAFAERWF